MLFLILSLLSTAWLQAVETADGIPDDSWPRVGLVLSGGGSRGHAHIGVLEALEAAGVPIYCIVGSSVGAVVGGLYASGYSPSELDSLMGKLGWQDMLLDQPDRRFMYTGRKELSNRHLVQLRFDGLKPEWAKGLSTGQKISQLLADLVWRAPRQGLGDFDQLRCRFRAVATDLESGMRMELGEGDLAEAMRASMSVPILFQPVEWEDRLLVDGGIADNIPVQTARRLGAEIVIAVDVTSPLRARPALREAWEVADQVVSIMQVRDNLASRAGADVLIRPELPNILLSQDGDRELLLASGERSMRGAMGELFRLRETLGRPGPEGANLPDRLPCDRLQVEGLGPILEDLDPGQLKSLELSATRGGYAMTGGADVTAEELVERLLAGLRRLGYTLVRLESMEEGAAGCRAVLDPGRLDELRITGLQRLHPSILKREFRPRVGHIFRVEDVDRAISRIYALGLFRWVTVSLLREEGRNVAHLKAREHPYPVLRAGLHYSSAQEGSGFAQLIWEGLMGRSLRGELTWIYGARRQEQRATLESDRIWKTWLTTRFGLSALEEDLWLPGEAWNMTDWDLHQAERKRYRLEGRFGQQISRLGMVSLSLAGERTEESGIHGQPAWSSARISLRSVVDNRDRLALSRHGQHHVVAVEEVVEEGVERSHRIQARFDTWRSQGRLTGHSTVLYGWSESPRRRERLEFGGDDWLRSIGYSQVDAGQAAGLRLETRYQLGNSDWHLSIDWALLALHQDHEGRLKRKDILQEAGITLHYDSLVGPLSVGAARLTEHALPWDPGWRLWVELGVPF